jgi:nucleoside-diphosphate-sugar epimerase
MNMLVTGGAGFIGSHLTEFLLQQGHIVRVLDNLSTGKLESLAHVPNSFEFIQGDIQDPTALDRACQDIDLIFHLAAMVSVVESVDSPQKAYATNLSGTVALLQAARHHGVKRVVQVSTCAVYGNTERLPASEDDNPNPMSPYAATKLAAEHAGTLFTALYGLDVVSLRFFNVYGPRQDPLSPYAAAIPRFIAAIRSGGQPTIYGDGRQTRDFVYVGDIVRAMFAAANAPQAAGQVINVGRGEECSVIELVEMIGQLTDIKVQPLFLPARPGEVQRSVASVAKLHALIGYQANTDLQTGLRQTLAI